MEKFIKTFEEFSKKENAFIVKSERIIPEGKKFENSKFLNFYIRIYIDINLNQFSSKSYSLQDVNLVKYYLDPSYKDPIRISEDRNNNFDVKVWTYGFYKIKAIIYLKLGQQIEIEGFVKFPVNDEEIKNNRGEVWK